MTGKQLNANVNSYFGGPNKNVGMKSNTNAMQTQKQLFI